MSDSGQAVESQPLLGETNITAGGSSKWRSVMWVVAMVAVSVVIVLLIALPLTLVERPAELTNGTAGADVTTESPNTTDVPDATDLPEGLGTTDDEFVTEVVDVVTEEAQVVTAAAQVVQAVGAADVLLNALPDEVVEAPAEDLRVPPPEPEESFNVCDDPNFRCKWVTEAGEIRDEATMDERLYWLEVAVTAAVSEQAHQTAAEIAQKMTSRMSPTLFAALAWNGKVGVQSIDEAPTVFPEYASLRDTPECAGRCDAECAITCYEPGAKYDALSGIGKVRGVETELNVLCLADDPYEGLDNGLVHEFSHTIHKYGIPYINGDWWNKILAAYDNAVASETWDITSRAMANYEEYWAKGTGVFFNTIHSDETGGMNSCGLAEGFCLCPEDAREWLAVKDPDLYAALVAIYGNGDPSVQAGLHICMNRPNNINCNNAPIDD